MAETFKKIRENAEGSKAHVKLDALSGKSVVVDKGMRNMYLNRFNRMTQALTDAGDSNTVMFSGGMELPKAKFASMVFDLRSTIVAMGLENLAKRITAFHNQRRARFMESLAPQEK